MLCNIDASRARATEDAPRFDAPTEPLVAPYGVQYTTTLDTMTATAGVVNSLRYTICALLAYDAARAREMQGLKSAVGDLKGSTTALNRLLYDRAQPPTRAPTSA